MLNSFNKDRHNSLFESYNITCTRVYYSSNLTFHICTYNNIHKFIVLSTDECGCKNRIKIQEKEVTTSFNSIESWLYRDYDCSILYHNVLLTFNHTTQDFNEYKITNLSTSSGLLIVPLIHINDVIDFNSKRIIEYSDVIRSRSSMYSNNILKSINNEMNKLYKNLNLSDIGSTDTLMTLIELKDSLIFYNGLLFQN